MNEPLIPQQYEAYKYVSVQFPHHSKKLPWPRNLVLLETKRDYTRRSLDDDPFNESNWPVIAIRARFNDMTWTLADYDAIHREIVIEMRIAEDTNRNDEEVF